MHMFVTQITYMRKITFYLFLAIVFTSCSKSDNGSNYKSEILGNYTNPEQPWSIFVSNSQSGLHTINATSDPADLISFST